MKISYHKAASKALYYVLLGFVVACIVYLASSIIAVVCLIRSIEP